METLIGLIVFLFCIVVPIALVIAAIVWIVRKISGGSPGPAIASGRAALDELDQLVQRWAAQGRLADAAAAQVRALIAEERLAQTQPTPAPAPLVPSASPPAEVAPAVAPTQVQPAAEIPPASAPMPVPLPVAPSASVPAVAADAPAAPREPWDERMGRALLSLRTRQTLLFLGAFLLVVSALVLVVFNWASFPPILQFALLAGVCGGLWAGGTWLARQSGLERAGAGLQAVGAVLVPVVAFSLSRPGLLDLEPRGAWLLASALSLPIYALAAWRIRHPLFAVAGCVSGASAVLAALSGVDNQWLPLALVDDAAGLPAAGALAGARSPRAGCRPLLGGAGRPAGGAAVRRAALDEWRYWRGRAGGDSLGRYGVLPAGGLAGAAPDLGLGGRAAGTRCTVRQPWPNRGAGI